MNLFTAILLVTAVAIIAATACYKYAKHRKFEKARQAALRPHIVWAEKVLAAEKDEMILSILRPRLDWRGPIQFPTIVGVATTKLRAAMDQVELDNRRRMVREKFAAACELEQLAGRVEAYLLVTFDYLEHGAELDEMRATVAEDVRQYTENLLESAHAGYRQQFVDLVAFTTPSYSYAVSDYTKLVWGLYQTPPDWDELVVRYYKTPTLSDFRGSYGVSMRGSLRLLAARALKEESLLLAQVVLAHFDSRASDSDLWRREVGVNLMTDLGKMVERLQVERKLVFT